MKIYETWLGSVGQLLLAVEGPESEYFGRFREIVNAQKNPVGVKAYLVRRVLDLSIDLRPLIWLVLTGLSADRL